MKVMDFYVEFVEKINWEMLVKVYVVVGVYLVEFDYLVR